jgi:hypothetical protein
MTARQRRTAHRHPFLVLDQRDQVFASHGGILRRKGRSVNRSEPW